MNSQCRLSTKTRPDLQVKQVNAEVSLQARQEEWQGRQWLTSGFGAKPKSHWQAPGKEFCGAAFGKQLKQLVAEPSLQERQEEWHLVQLLASGLSTYPESHRQEVGKAP